MTVNSESDARGAYSITIHGTWATLKRKSKWWRPNGELFRYLQKKPAAKPSKPGLGPAGANLYDQWDYFYWTGILDREARSIGAEDLAQWCETHNCNLDRVFTHSHGGNVALDAAQEFDNIRINLLILMSAPAHERSDEEWRRISGTVDRILSLRCRFDFVVLSDRCYSLARGIPASGAFPKDRVRDYPIPGLWFDHSAITCRSVWKKNKLALLVAREAKKIGRLPA